METILIVDDEEDIIIILKSVLEKHNYKVLSALSGIEAINIVKLNNNINLIVLDIMLPDIDGFSLIRNIREKTNVPILFLSAKSEIADKVKGLALGADDYISKPFDLDEFISRVKAHLRRENMIYETNRDNISTFLGDYIINPLEYTINYKNQKLQFTKKEFDIIELLAFNPNQVFSREQIFNKIWEYDSNSETSTVTEHIKKIRSKFSDNNIEDPISTIWGIGYKWSDDN